MAKGDNYYYGLGRRKEATASVHLSLGKGIITANGKPAQEYFGHTSLVERVTTPFTVIGKEDQFDVAIRAKGGGKSGQADAARLAVANALTVMSEDLRTTLKKAGLIKRDSRIKERKKPGLKRARKAPQFTKR